MHLTVLTRSVQPFGCPTAWSSGGIVLCSQPRKMLEVSPPRMLQLQAGELASAHMRKLQTPGRPTMQPFEVGHGCLAMDQRPHLPQLATHDVSSSCSSSDQVADPSQYGVWKSPCSMKWRKSAEPSISSTTLWVCVGGANNATLNSVLMSADTSIGPADCWDISSRAWVSSDRRVAARSCATLTPSTWQMI